MLISAFYLEYFHGALPCDLCITQRWFHGAIIAYSLIIILILNKNLIKIYLDCLKQTTQQIFKNKLLYNDIKEIRNFDTNLFKIKRIKKDFIQKIFL